MIELKILCGKILAWRRGVRGNDLGSVLLLAALMLVSAFDEGDSDSVPTEPPAASPATDVVPQAPAGQDQPTGPKASSTPGQHPNHLLKLPASAPGALVFDLVDYRMHLFARRDDSDAASELETVEVGNTFVAVGKQGLYKAREGDEKTPLGIYFVTSYIPGDELPAIYGVGAYPLDYPNTWDRRRDRTGSGIWIHGTDKDEESLLPKSSRGCLTLHNHDFETLEDLVEIRRTPVIVSDRVDWVDPAEVAAMRDGLAAAIEAWRQDWESLDTDRYLSHYSRDFRTDSMNLRRWSSHKRRVNANKSYIRVGIDDLGIYAYPGEPGLYLVTFDQSYESSNYRAVRWKQQYWRREDGTWRIVHEVGR
ncbi:MAG: L,D-transpeptidase family protein [Acidobacteriota bacterium]